MATVKDEIVQILSSGGRVDRGTDQPPEPDIVNIHAAVRELQDAVVRLAKLSTSSAPNCM